MKKLLIAFVLFTCFAFQTQQEKKVTLTFSIEEVQLIYDALGELPAKKVEVLRIKIVQEANKQLADTVKKK